MSACKASYDDVDVFYRRVPITAERSPDFSDFGELFAVMLSPNMSHTPIVVNDQLGRGRSTLTSVGVNWRKLCPHLYLRWAFIRSSLFYSSSGLCSCHRVLESESADFRLRRMGRFPICNPPILPFGGNHIQSSTVCAIKQRPSPALSVNISPDLLRVIRKGPAVKSAVDDAIDQCAEVFNLRDSIEEARIRAEQVTDQREKRSFAQRGLSHPPPQRDIFPHSIEGLQNLRRYFELIVFQAFLQSTEPDTLQTYQTFESFVNNLPGKVQVPNPGNRMLIGVSSNQDIREGAARRRDRFFETTEAC
jgi:Inositol hexakisphosphate